MVLVDTSCWIHCLRRRGDRAVVDRITAHVHAGTAAWCPVIRLELWNGVGSEKDREALRDFERILPEFAITAAVWDEACELADRCRTAGKTAPPNDVLIAACALHYALAVESSDAHFDFLMSL